MNMDSGIESTENSSGSSTDASSLNLNEVQFDSQSSIFESDDTVLHSDSCISDFREPSKLYVKMSSKKSQSHDASSFKSSNNYNTEIPLASNASIEFETSDSGVDEKFNENVQRPLQIPRIDISSYDSETSPKSFSIHFRKIDERSIHNLGFDYKKLETHGNSLSTDSWKRDHVIKNSRAVLPYKTLTDVHLYQKIKLMKKIVRQAKSLYPKEKKLRTAAGLNNVKLVEQLLNEGINPKAVDERNRTALHIAASKGYSDVVSLLLQHGADPNQKDSLGNTALHLAACTSHIEIVTVLLKAGTDVKQADNQGFSPLHLANSRLSFLMRDSNPSCQGLRWQVIQIVEMMQQYLKSSGQTKEAEQLTALTNKMSLSENTSGDDENIIQLLSSLQNLTLSKVKTT